MPEASMKWFHTVLGLVLLLVSVAPAWALEEQETASLQSSAASDGNGTAVSVTRYATIGLDVEVTNTATVTFEGRSAGASSFSSMRCTNRATGSASTTATSTGNYECPVAGLGEVRARISSCSGCVVNVFGRLTTAPPGLASSGGGGGGAVSTLDIASGVTTNTSTTPVAGVSGVKNFQWVVTGTGAVTQTAVLKGSFDSDGASPTDLCTITLSGTAPVYDVCQPFTAPFPYLFVTTTSTTGTGASGTGRLGY